MCELIEFKDASGDPIFVEVAPSGGSALRGTRPTEAVVEAGKSLEQVVGRLGPTIRAIVSELHSVADSPAEVEIEFAVKLSADSNLIIARAGGEANFRIALRWSRASRAPSS